MKGYFPENSPEKGSETLTYIDRINEFHLWLESNALPVLSQLMYYNLLHVFNRAGWPEYVQVDNLRMMIWLGGASKTTVIRAREKLAAAGFIRVKRGGKGCPNRYELVDLRYSHATINDTQNDTRNATRTDTPSDTHIKTKTKTKKESSCIVVIDHIGLMKRPEARSDYRALGMVSNRLKALALDKKITVVQLCQMNRQIESRKGGRPTLSDLRESGDLEQDSDVVAFLVPEALDGRIIAGEDSVSVALDFQKVREGGQARINFRWQPQYHQYTEVEERRFDSGGRLHEI